MSANYLLQMFRPRGKCAKHLFQTFFLKLSGQSESSLIVWLYNHGDVAFYHSTPGVGNLLSHLAQLSIFIDLHTWEFFNKKHFHQMVF